MENESQRINMQHQSFPQNGKTEIDLTQNKDDLVISVLKIATIAVNEAIKEGAESVTIKYANLLDPLLNPHGVTGHVMTTGYRTKPQ